MLHGCAGQRAAVVHYAIHDFAVGSLAMDSVRKTAIRVHGWVLNFGVSLLVALSAAS